MGTCEHDALFFPTQSGTYYLECRHCGAQWAAIDDMDVPRHEALKEGYGVSEDRNSPFYVRPFLMVSQLDPAMKALRVTTDASGTILQVNMDQAIEMLYGRPQAGLLKAFEPIARRFVGKRFSKETQDAFLGEAKIFLRGIAARHVPR